MLLAYRNGFKILHGDCIEVLKTFEDDSLDSCVCDPPYGLEFMGKDWDAPWKQLGDVVQDPATVGGFQDGNGGNPYSRSRIRYGRGNGYQQWCEAWAREVLRVLKPGAHLLAFGGTRTYHRMVCAIEDAGFEIRDQIGWLYGSGFPKSLDVSKAIDKAAGAKRKIIGKWKPTGKARLVGGKNRDGIFTDYSKAELKGELSITAPATPAAQQWNGWGTALKPAWEPIVVARKPLIGTVAQNVLRFGTGAINVDGSRVRIEDGYATNKVTQGGDHFSICSDKKTRGTTFNPSPNGRWPANVIHDGSDEVLAEFPETKGPGFYKNPCAAPEKGKRGGAVQFSRTADNMRSEISRFSGDTGTAARFFKACEFGNDELLDAARILYCAKASKRDRDEGLVGFESHDIYSESAATPMRDHREQAKRRNHHPTVKPTALMRYLVRLVTPPGGTVLDCFAGSGSTGKAARLEGFGFVGVERESDYVKIANARIDYVTKR